MFGTITRLVLRALPVVLSSPLYAAFGALVLVRGTVRVVLRFVRLATLFRGRLRCQQGHAVPVTGRFACRSCGSEYLGHISICTCGATAEFTRCPECAVYVALPWSDR